MKISVPWFDVNDVLYPVIIFHKLEKLGEHSKISASASNST